MKTKENKFRLTLKNIVIGTFLFFLILYVVMFYKMYIPTNKSYAKENENNINQIDTNSTKISNAKTIDIDEIINQNTSNNQTEQITKTEEILEYLTEYRTNKEIPKGIIYVVQEGLQGKQEITTKTTFDKDGNKIKEEQTEAEVTKAAINKIVEIGGANYTDNYKVKVGDVVKITSDMLSVMEENNEESRKITTLKQNDELKVLEISSNWYKISYQNTIGWVKKECTIHKNLNENKQNEKTAKGQVSGVSKDIQLNKPSGLTLEQFKKVLTDSKDKNHIFSDNAEYFYYIEKQYNINGLFVAALGIHESAWGTSKIALNKNNLFGYGAYDSNPYNGAYQFDNYAESIDLLARVMVKYYLNPKGTSIYGGEKAVGTYYNGATLNGVNTRYGTDKNWENAIFSHMKYLYGKM